MVSLDWSTDRTDGVTLVALRVESPQARRVRVENRIDGPLWPPRRQGRPAAGWDWTGFEGVVEAGGVLALGYATPGEPADPPAEVVAAEPLSGGSGYSRDGSLHATADATGPPGEGRLADPATRDAPSPDGRIDDRTPAGVVRSLGDPVVPREAVPVPVSDDATDTPARDLGTGSGDASGRSANSTRSRLSDGEGGDPGDHRRSEGDRDLTGSESLSARLAAIEGRLAALER